MFHISTYRPSLFKHLSHRTVRNHQLRQSWHRSSRHAGQVICSLSTVLSLLWANFVHQTCIAGLGKHLSPYTGGISEWISFALSPFAHKKKIKARCSLRDDFNSNVAIFNVYKRRSQWLHRNKTHSWYLELNSLQNVYFGFFIFGKLTEWCCFVTYLLNDPRITKVILTCFKLESIFTLIL